MQRRPEGSSVILDYLFTKFDSHQARFFGAERKSLDPSVRWGDGSNVRGASKIKGRPANARLTVVV